MQETTAEIVFKNKEEAYAVLGDRDAVLRSMEENFDCGFVSRGMSLAVTGAPAEVAAVRTLVDEMLFLHKQGTKPTTHEAVYGARLIKEGRIEELHSLFTEVLLVTAKGKSVRAKTAGQRDYLSTIRRNAVTLGVGPAGTGKTYLAVVMAVAALRSREVSRIILTRPAVEAGEHLGFLPGDLTEKINPYLRPLYDALQDLLGTEAYQKMMSRGLIEVAPPAYTRGAECDGGADEDVPHAPRVRFPNGGHGRPRAGRSAARYGIGAETGVQNPARGEGRRHRAARAGRHHPARGRDAHR